MLDSEATICGSINVRQIEEVLALLQCWQAQPPTRHHAKGRLLKAMVAAFLKTPTRRLIES